MIKHLPPSSPVDILPTKWWETASGIIRTYLKATGQTLSDLAAALDHYAAMGIDTLEVFAPLQGGICYHGLDTIDFYRIDPAIGTREDFDRLVAEAHARKMAVVLFINLGYANEQFPSFVKACDDQRSGVDSPETHWFCWSETGMDQMDRSHAPYFMNDSHGSWCWSERAGKFYWVKWEGENGGYHFPQFNFGDPGWQAEARRIIIYWMDSGIDGMVVDAVNWYIDCTWEICRAVLTSPIHAKGDRFSQPEGAGGFRDDPVPWVAQGGWNCIMDYSVKLWWEGIDVIRDAILSGDPRPIEAALRSYRDRVVAAGGVCYIDPPNLADQLVNVRLLGAALVASMGELMILIGDEINPQPETYRDGLTQLFLLRKQYPALCAAGERTKLRTSDDSRFYAYLRELPGAEPVLVVFNFQPTDQSIRVSLPGWSNFILVDQINSEQGSQVEGEFTLNLPAFGYGFYLLRMV